MESTRPNVDGEDEFSSFTRMLAAFCHDCGVCRYAARRPGSVFGRFTGWCRSWCPESAAHSRVYGDQPLEYDDDPCSPTESDWYDEWE